jgi:hypothetical protein
VGETFGRLPLGWSSGSGVSSSSSLGRALSVDSGVSLPDQAKRVVA